MQDIQRYLRQYTYQPIGKAGQKKICASRAAIIGCGALGTVMANTLARAGVGFLRIVDRDVIELNNLQRQVLFDEKDIELKLPKAAAAGQKIKAVNSQISVEAIVSDVNPANIENYIGDADLVMDATDNFETRYLINDACIKLGKPWIYTACVGSCGMTMTILPGETPCLRCIFESFPPPEQSPTCFTAGIIAPAATVIASLACTEALKFFSGNKKALSETLFSFDVWTREIKTFRLAGLRETGNCPCCHRKNFEFLESGEAAPTTYLCSRNAVQINRPDEIPLDFPRLAARLEKIGKVSFNSFLLQAEIEKYTVTVFAGGRAIVFGTGDAAKAKLIYSKYIE